MVRRGSVVTLVMSLNHGEQERTYCTILSLSALFGSKLFLRGCAAAQLPRLGICHVFVFQFSSWCSPHCNAYGWLRSSVRISVFSHASRWLHPRVLSGCVFSAFLSTASLTPLPARALPPQLSESSYVFSNSELERILF